MAPSKPETLAYSVLDAASCVGVSPNYVRKLLRNGELESFRVGQKILIPKSSLEVYVMKSTYGGRS